MPQVRLIPDKTLHAIKIMAPYSNLAGEVRQAVNRICQALEKVPDIYCVSPPEKIEKNEDVHILYVGTEDVAGDKVEWERIVLPGGTYAFMQYSGSLEDYADFYIKLPAYLRQNGHEPVPRHKGWYYELYRAEEYDWNEETGEKTFLVGRPLVH